MLAGGSFRVEIEAFKAGDRARWSIVLTNPFVDEMQRSYELMMDGFDEWKACEVQSLQSGTICVQEDDLAVFLSAMVFPIELAEPAAGLDRTRAQMTQIESTCFGGWVESPVRFYRRACYGDRGELTEWELLAARTGGIVVTDTIEVSASIVEPLADQRDLSIPYTIVQAAN